MIVNEVIRGRLGHGLLILLGGALVGLSWAGGEVWAAGWDSRPVVGPFVWADSATPGPSAEEPRPEAGAPLRPRSTAPSWAYLPAEFEPIEALVLPAGLLAQQAPDLLIQMFQALQEHTAVVGLVQDGRQRHKVEKLLAERNLGRRNLRLVEIPHDTLWLRDYGPIFFRFPDAHPGAYDAEYPDPRRRLDDAVPVRLAALFGISVFPLPMVLEGGNLLTNGQGLALTTQTAVLRHSGPSASEASLRQLLYQHLGIDTLVILEPLAGEPTGHVDMFACFTGPDTVLVGQYDPKEDPVNAAILDRNAALLVGCRTAGGPLRVIRLPMPSHRDRIWRTYTNVVFANRLLLVPTYPASDQAADQRALEIYRRLLPGWKVVGIDTSPLITLGGGLRCISLGIPAPTPNGTWGAALSTGFGLVWRLPCPPGQPELSLAGPARIGLLGQR